MNLKESLAETKDTLEIDVSIVLWCYCQRFSIDFYDIKSVKCSMHAIMEVSCNYCLIQLE